MIVGTAGHVDHGKTALVRALTGVDTDRLPDERRRGITIDLGFAPLALPDGRIASVVDVPGHESLVHTMIAGAAGIRVALVVVAADEGVMPQTREHLRVLSALGLRSGVLAMTKCDLVDADRLATTSADARAALGVSSLGALTPIATSVRTGNGVAAVRDALAALLDAATLPSANDVFRFHTDRVFVVRGTGTVVTGTVASGTITTGERVTVLPGGHSARVRGIQMHGAAATRALPGMRAALALADVTVEALQRGSVIVTSDAWSPGTRLLARVQLAGHGAMPRRCLLYLGGAVAVARLVPGNEPVAADAAIVRIVLDRPVVARRGDRFVLRSTDPRDTIGGGEVLDPSPERGARAPLAHVFTDPAEWLSAMMATTRGAGVCRAALPVRLGVAPSDVEAIVSAVVPVEIGGRLVARAWYEALGVAAVARARAWCTAHPLAPGIPLAELRVELQRAEHASAEVVDAALHAAAARGEVVLRDGMVAPAERSALSPSHAALLARVVHRVCECGREPPSVAELTAELGPAVPEILMFAARQGNLVRVESVRYYGAEIIRDVVRELRRAMVAGRLYSPSELRSIVGVSRKYLIPLLEHCDAVGVTERHSGGRIICTVSSASDVQVSSNNRSGVV